MEVIKTVRVPVHHALTKRKLSILDRLTARHSYCVWLFSKLIEERKMSVRGYGRFTKDDLARIAALTKLQCAYVQQCRDQALWMWRSYYTLHEEWERRVSHAEGKWHVKLLKREPRKPLRDGLARKIPIRIDLRTGSVEGAKRIRLSPFVLRLSSLRRNARITIPLSLARYHLELLSKGRAIDFQLVKRDGKYFAHVCVKNGSIASLVPQLWTTIQCRLERRHKHRLSFLACGTGPTGHSRLGPCWG